MSRPVQESQRGRLLSEVQAPAAEQQQQERELAAKEPGGQLVHTGAYGGHLDG